MAKTVTLRIENDSYRIFARRAQSERRSLSNYIEIAALGYAEQSSLADDLEMEEIFNNANLLKRLKKGSQQVNQRKGRFVA